MNQRLRNSLETGSVFFGLFVIEDDRICIHAGGHHGRLFTGRGRPDVEVFAVIER